MKAASNLKKVYTLPVNQLNAEVLLSKDTVIMTVDAARWAEDALASDPHGRRGSKFAATVVEAIENSTEPLVEQLDEVVAESSKDGE